MIALRRMSFLGLMAVAGILALGATASSAPPPQMSVPHVVLIEQATGTVLFERGADDLVMPASTAKLMTADLVFELLKQGKLRRDQLFTVSETAWRQGGAPSRGSTMFAKVHSQISIQDLLRGLIVDSANDAAIVLAEGIAGSQGAFATRMTERAKELGLARSTFTDAWGGVNPDQRVSAHDMARLASHIIETYPDDYKMFAERDFTWNNIRQPNRNPLLALDLGADGLKTGYLEESGFSIVGSAVQNGERLVLALYGAKTAKERLDESYKILQWGFRSFENRKLFAAGATVGEAQVYGGEARHVALVTERDINVLASRDGGEKLTAKVAYTGPLMAPVQAGVTLANLKIYRGDTEIMSAPLQTAAAVPVGSLPKRALSAGIEYVGALFRKYVLRS